MSMTKYAYFGDSEVLEVKGSPTRAHTASIQSLSDFHDYRTDDGYMYVRLRAISSRVNRNNDGWPSIELAGGPDIFERHAKQSSSGFTVEATEGNGKYGFATFMGKPNFIDHNNSDPTRARGVVVDAKLRVLPIERVASSGDDYWTSASLDPEHAPPTEIELLLEIDAKQFPKYAKAIRSGDLDGFSMGCDVERSKCSHCGHVATNPDEYCSHILMKGAHHDYKTADGKRISRKSYENCYGIHFFEISGVFDPADETALAREVRAGIIHEGERTANFQKGSPDPGDDTYFGGKPGAAKEAFEAMKKQYGDEKGEEVYYRTRNKKKGKSTSSFVQSADTGVGIPSSGNFSGGQFDARGSWDDAQYDASLFSLEQKQGLKRSQEVSSLASVNLPNMNGLSGRPSVSNVPVSLATESSGKPLNQSTISVGDLDTGGKISSIGRASMMQRDASLAINDPGKVAPVLGSGFHTDYYTADSNKHKGKDSSVHTAENPLPQSFETTAPEEVDTMRQEHKCPICGEQMDGETCDVCGYVEPPKGMDNPDLTKAKELQQDMQQGSQQEVQQDNAMARGAQPIPNSEGQPMPPPGGPAAHAKQPGSFLQTRNRGASASVMDDMRWQPKLNPKVAARIKQFEKPLLPGTAPATNDPATTTVVKNPQKPITAAMRNAQDLIEAAKKNHTGDTMSTQKTADGPTGPEAAPDARVDTTGVGGVIEPSNDAASKADAQVDVTGVGSTGVTDVSADKTESLPTASETSDDSGFDATKTVEDSGPTSTFGDSDGTEKGFTDEVTNESLEGNQNKDSSVRQAYDAKPFYDQPGLSGGSANQGTQPVDAVGKAQDRVDVLSPATTPENNSGPTSQWTGTDGNKIYRQQNPVTPESIATDGFTSHFVASLKLADMEVDLGLIEKDAKYERLAELSPQSDEEISAQMDMLSRVKTAGTKKLAAQRTSGVTRMPGAFGKTTASAKRFDSVISSDESEIATITEDSLDSALFA
jgi:hypothetical protein